MLPIVLVLLVATSALAAPTVELNLLSINDVAPAQSNGQAFGRWSVENAFESYDASDDDVNTLTMKSVLSDLANSNDPDDQASTVLSALALLVPVSTGVQGDACAASNAIDAYVRNPGSRGAIGGFIQALVNGIDQLVKLTSNTSAARFAIGSRGNCQGGGRTYAFEAAWDKILSKVNSASAGLINEKYCTAKRLFQSFNARSNNIAAYVTAASLPGVVSVGKQVVAPVSQFLSCLSSGNCAQYAGAAKQALLSAKY